MLKHMVKNKKIKRERACIFCKNKTVPVWEDYEKLGEFLSARSRILSSQASGTCVRHQRKLAKAIKQARHLGLLPFTTQE
ncbi:MAG TPA: 30S ribosomal protein S18 [Patescibacteria group bacterium]